MFKNYWKELKKKITNFEWVIIFIFSFFILFFSVFDIKNHKIIFSLNWSLSVLTIIGQIFLFLAGFLSILVIMNRIHRFKQEMIFLLLGALFSGLGLLLQGYSYWRIDPNDFGANLMGPGFVQLFVFGLSSVGGFAQFNKHEENIIPAKKKFLSKELWIGIFISLFTILPYYMLFDKLSANNNQISGQSINYAEWIGILSFSFASAAIVVMTIFRWTWTFLFWTIANVLFIIYYWQIDSLPMFIISCLFTFVNLYILFKWIKN